MKRTVYVAFAILFLLAGLSSVALAAQNVTNPSQKGSLVVLPKIVVERDLRDNVVTDTVVTIVNDYTNFVDIKCYWVDQDQNYSGFCIPDYAKPDRLVSSERRSGYDRVGGAGGSTV